MWPEKRKYDAQYHSIIVLCSLFELNPPLRLFHSEFDKVLTQLHWPIISPPTQSLTPTANYQEINSQLELLVTQLLALQTSYPSVWASTHPCSALIYSSSL